MVRLNMAGVTSLALLAGSVLAGCESAYELKVTQKAAELLSSQGQTAGTPGTTSSPLPPPNSEICVEHPDAEACKKIPAVTTPGVVTVLFTMSQIPQGAGSLILANAIKFASPVANPKILFFKDSNTGGEDEGDPTFIKNTLLQGYDLEYGVVPSTGLSPSSVAGKDLIIISNPGHPLSNKLTMDTLMDFKGGVILVGDDMGYGIDFSTEALTGLKFKGNGNSMTCGGKTYAYDNYGTYKYQIDMNEEFLPGLPAELKHYEYANDLDWTEQKAGMQVLAWASSDPRACSVEFAKVPAIVRYEKL